MRISTAASTITPKNLTAADEGFKAAAARNSQADVAPTKNPRAEAPTTNPKSDPLRTATLEDIVKAAGNATHLPTADATATNKEWYGTSSFTHPHIDEPDRFGFQPPSEQNPIDVINERAGWGFNPQRDLQISPEDAASAVAKGSHRSSAPVEEGPIEDPMKQKEPTCEPQPRTDPRGATMIDTDHCYESQQPPAKPEEPNQCLPEIRGPRWTRLKLLNPNPEAPDNSGGGPNDPLINNLGSDRRIRQPFVDPSGEQQFGPSGVMKARGQATDPNPDTDPNTGAALRSIRNTSDAVTDPGPTLQVAFLKAVIRG
jgi:hypothetical protein